MSSDVPLEVHLDELEREVLRRALAVRAATVVNEEELLSAVRRRIALVPLNGLPSIEIPPIPGSPPGSAGAGASTSTVAKVNCTKGADAALEVSMTKPAAFVPMKALLPLSQVQLLAAGVIAGTATLVPVLGNLGSISESVPRDRPSSLEVDRRPELRVEETQERESTAPRMPARPDGVRTDGARSVAEGLERGRVSSPEQSAPRGHGRVSSGVSPPPDSSLDKKLPDTSVDNKAPDVQPTLGGQRSSDSSLMTEDLRRIREAQKALQAGAPSKALELVSQIPKGPRWSALGPELGLTQILALCALGDSVGAKRVARALAQSGAGSVYTVRLKKTCVSEEPSDP